MQGVFFIHTDQKSLIHLNEQRLHTPLLGLQYKVIYKQGLENGAVNALSHCQSSDQVMALSTVQPIWLTELLACYDSDSVAQHLLSKLSQDSSAEPHFSLTDGVLRYDGKIWLGSYTTLHSKVFAALHSSALGCPSGDPTTYHRIKQLFYWPHMKSDILAWV